MSNINNLPDFSHRTGLDSNDLEDFKMIDLYAVMAKYVENIQHQTMLMSMQHEPEGPVILEDSENLHIISQINSSALDVLAMTEWFANNFDVVKTTGELSESI